MSASPTCSGKTLTTSRGSATPLRPALPAVLLAALLVTVSLPVHGNQSMRCDRTFIRVGDSQFQVLEACGEPKFREQISGEDGPRVEQWVYASQWSRFDRMLTIVAGRVARIERLND